MSEIRNYIPLDIAGKQAFRYMLPTSWLNLVKVTLLKSYYDSEYKIDGLMKTPYTGDHIFLYDIKTNATHQDALTFTVVDKNRDRWQNKNLADLIIFVFREKGISCFLTRANLVKLLNDKYRIKSKFNPSEYVYLSLEALKENASLILQNGQFSLPNGDSTEVSVKRVWQQDFIIASGKNNNPIKSQSIEKIFEGLGTISYV